MSFLAAWTSGKARPVPWQEERQGAADGAASGPEEARNVGPARGPFLPAQALVPEAGKPTVPEVLRAMRADSVPAGSSGLWEVRKVVVTDGMADATASGRYPHRVPAGNYTNLFRATMATVHLDGECVMNDFPGELRKHLEFVLVARGRVLVTGLGLGCVVRGLLAVGRAESIDVVERDKHVVRLAWPSVEEAARGNRAQVRLHVSDALRFARKTMERWDFAWHDLWSDPDVKEPHLVVTHAEVMAALRGKAARQGAWAFPREHRRTMERLAGIAGVSRGERWNS